MGTWIASLGLVALLIGTLASAGCEARTASEPTGTISVRVAMFGGPPLNGKMALDNAPASGVTVTATDADGTKWTAITGIAVIVRIVDAELGEHYRLAEARRWTETHVMVGLYRTDPDAGLRKDQLAWLRAEDVYRVLRPEDAERR